MKSNIAGPASRILFSLLLLVGACEVDHWPIDEPILRQNYFDNQEQFFSLFELVTESGYEHVFIAAGKPGVRVSVPSSGHGPDKTTRLETDAVAGQINAIMKKLGVTLASNYNNEVRLEISRPYESGEFQSIHYVTNTGATQLVLDRCDDLAGDPPLHGTCLVSLDRTWRIEYSW